MELPGLRKLASAVQVLGTEARVLPATGGAVEYLQRPDREEIEDGLIHAGDERITAFLEDPEPTVEELYVPAPPIHRNDRHQFHYFLDGSLRTYFLGTVIEGNRSFPVELAQIGAAVIERSATGQLRVKASRRVVLLLVPHSDGTGLSDTAWTQLSQLSDIAAGFEVIDFAVPDVLNANAQRDPRDKAGAKARYRMHRLEIDLIQATDADRSDDAWLIIDGAVKLDEFIEAPHLLGVAKAFRKDPEFHFGRGRGSRRFDITSILAGLPQGHRTRAFSSHGGKVAFWYLRLREQRQVDYPLMGVVKIELPRPDGSPAPSALVDRLSSCLVAERSVTPYGLDARWHCHLYPIYAAEEAIKAGFYSQEVLFGSIRWPEPA